MAKSAKEQLEELEAKYKERLAKQRAKTKGVKATIGIATTRAEAAENALKKVRKRARKNSVALGTCRGAKAGKPASQLKEALAHLKGIQVYLGKSAKAISSCAVKMGDHSYAVVHKGKGHIKDGRYVDIRSKKKSGKKSSGKLTKKEQAIAKDILKKMGKKATAKKSTAKRGRGRPRKAA